MQTNTKRKVPWPIKAAVGLIVLIGLVAGAGPVLTRLNDLTDVQTAYIPGNGQALIYNSTTKRWTNGAAVSALGDGDYGDVTVSGGGASINIDSGVVGTAEVTDGSLLSEDFSPLVWPASTNTWNVWMVSSNGYRARQSSSSTIVTSNNFAGLLQYAYDNSPAGRIHFNLAPSVDGAGYYRISRTVELTNQAKFFTFEGSGNPSTVLVPLSSMTNGEPMFRVGSSNHSQMNSVTAFKKLRFQANQGGFGNVHTNLVTGIRFENAPEPVVEDTEFSQVYSAVEMATPTSTHWGYMRNCWFVGTTNSGSTALKLIGANSSFSDLKVQDCKFWIEGGNGLWISNSFDNILVSDSIFYNNQGTGNGIRITSGTNLVVSGCIFDKYSTTTVPIRFDDRAAAQDVMATIVGNTFTGTSTNMVYIGTNVHGVNFVGNRHSIAGSPLVTAAGANTNGLVLDHQASLFPMLSTPTNYTSASKALKDHLDGVDDALGAVGGGDSVSVDGGATVNPNFDDGGDIDFAYAAGTVTATVKTNTIGSGDVIDASIAAADLGIDSVSASELDAPGVTNELALILRLQDLQGAVTDGQVPNTITIDLATTATTANAGDNATVFFVAGQIERARGGTGDDTSAYGNGLLGSDAGNNTIDVDTVAELDTAIGLTGTPDATTFFRGDGTWAGAGAADNLGNHLATQNLNMATFSVTNAGSLSLSGSGAGSETLWDTDASHHYRMIAAGVTGTNINEIKPNQPTTGFYFWTVDTVTNATASIITSITAAHLGTDSVSSDELNAPGITNELAAILRLGDLQGAVTDGQVPNTITIDLATTATTANAGDSATAFFSSGTIETNYLPILSAFPGVATDAQIPDSVTVTSWTMGDSVATTPAASDNDTSLATTAFVTGSTVTFTGKTLDAAGTGNVLKQTKYLQLQRPDYGDGAGAVPQTNNYAASGLMHYTLSGAAETNVNWVVYEFDCPPDLDTAVAMTARFAFLSGGIDVDDYVFHLTYGQVAAGTAYPTGTGIASLPIVMTAPPTSAANGDIQQSPTTTLTGWAAALTAGLPMQVRVARLQNTQDDGSRDVQLVIAYGSTL